jgi:iron complex outermembrane receptor protein
VQPEFVRAREIGYLGEFAPVNLALDVRIFNEQLSGVIVQSSGASGIKTFSNADSFAIDGVEYQIKWRPWQGGQVIFNQSFTHIDSPNADTALSAPQQSNALVFFQKLPGNVDFSLLHQSGDQRVLSENRATTLTRSISRTDLRVAVPFKLGTKQGEWAVTLQNLGPAYSDFDPKRASFQQRSFMSLSLEM